MQSVSDGQVEGGLCPVDTNRFRVVGLCSRCVPVAAARVGKSPGVLSNRGVSD